MRTFAIIEDSVVSNVIVAPAWTGAIDVTDAEPRPAPGWTFDGESFHPPVSAVVPTPPGARKITNLAFDLRFTPEERVAIEMASLDDPGAPAAQRQQAAYIRVALQRANKATYTDLDDLVTRSSVEQFEQFGMIATGRAAEILDAPIEDRERYA